MRLSMDNATAPIKFIVKQDPCAGESEGDGGAAGAGENGAAGAGGGEGFQIPEKFLVKSADGQPDYLKSLEKVHNSYSEIEKRVGAVGLPPKTAAEYKLEKYLPEGFESKPEEIKPILERFHAAGMSNKQVQEVFNAFGQSISGAVESNKAAFEAGQAALRAEWGDDYDKQVNNAGLAKRAYFDDAMTAELVKDNLDTKPVIIKLLAKVGAELNDDKLPSQMNPADLDSIDSLRNSAAYRDTKHPEHKLTVAKVNAAYQAGYKARD